MGLDWKMFFLLGEENIFITWLYIICNAWSFGIMMGRGFLDLFMERLTIVSGVDCDVL